MEIKKLQGTDFFIDADQRCVAVGRFAGDAYEVDIPRPKLLIHEIDRGDGLMEYQIFVGILNCTWRTICLLHEEMAEDPTFSIPSHMTQRVNETHLSAKTGVCVTVPQIREALTRLTLAKESREGLLAWLKFQDELFGPKLH